VPRSVIEALAAGRPAIVTDIRGSNELVEDGVNGWMVPAGDVAALAEVIGRVAQLAPEDLSRWGARARESVDPARRESRVLARLVAAYANAGVPPPRTAGST
jgi:colanic acid/amylovoran biosynthesis glycosyltransferase